MIFEPNNCKQRASRYIDEARQVLLASWGLDLEQNKNQNSGGTYHFVSQKLDELEEKEREEKIRQKTINDVCNDNTDISAKKALLLVVLGCIVLQGGAIRKDEFNKIICDKLDTTRFAATPEKLVATLSREKWITIEKDSEGSETYKLGQRCDEEFTPPDIYRAVYRLIYNGQKPNENDAALQRILNDFETRTNQVNDGNNNRNKGRPPRRK